MSSFGGNGWPAASQKPASSPFATNPFPSASNPSPFSSSPFGAQPTAAASQNNGSSVPNNPFAAKSSASSTSTPNPFAVASTPGAPAVNNPFGTSGSTQNSSPSLFGAKNVGGIFGASSQARSDRTPSPFSMPANQGRPNDAANTTRPNPFGAPTLKSNSGVKAPFGGNLAPTKRFGAASDAEEHSGSDASVSSKRNKRRQGDNIGDSNGKLNGKKGAIQDGVKRNAQAAPDGKGFGKGLKPPAPNGVSFGGPGKKSPFEQPANGSSRPGSRFSTPAPGPRNPTPAALRAKGRETANMNDPYAKKIMDQLARDKIHPPTWPSDPGKPSNKNVMMSFREEYKEYRERARASLVRAGLIDDPEDRKRLEDALDFKGICEDMCPEFEKVTRITEFDIKQAEKDPDNNWPDTARMVKKLARSAAGQEAPLPMDVRSVPAIRRTLDYLIDDFLDSDENLPIVHGFLWDRTRAIRRDFAFFSSMTPEEMRDQVHCLETIARFHVTSLHLLSMKDSKPEDFSEQQEVEQLGKTLISLMYAYDDCNARGIVCDYEAEFRAYQLLFRASHSDVLEIVQREWDAKLWQESDEIRTAVSLVEALQNTHDLHGPLKGGPSFAAAGAYNSYFRIVEDPRVSFTMACFAEIHFGQLRRSILVALKKAYSRPKQIAKDVTAAVLNSYLRFDTVWEAVEFAENHGLSFTPDDDNPDDIQKSYVVLEYGKGLEYQRLHHTFSAAIVEKKRGSHTLPDVIHQTVFEATASQTTQEAAETADAKDSLFAFKPLVEHQQAKQQPPSALAQAKPSPFAPVGNGLVSATTTAPRNNLDATTPATGFLSKPPSATPTISSQAIATAPGGGSQPSPFAQPSSTPATGIKFGQSIPPVTQQPAFTPLATFVPPAPKFSLKPTQPPAATTTATPVPAPPSVPNTAPAASFNFLGPASATGATTSPAIKVTPPTPGFPTPPSTATAPKSATAPLVAQPPSFSPQPPTTQAPAISQTTPTAPTLFQPPPTPASQAAPPVQPPSAALLPTTKHDRWGQFVKWFVAGDDGLLEQFQTYVVEEAVRKVYEQFVRDEKERKRQEEDDRSWAEARKFRTYNLGVKYFYRWREIARQNRASALRRSGRDQLRAYQEAKHIERLRLQKKAARLQRQLAEEGVAVDNVEDLKGLIAKRSQNKRETEDALLASGVLSGVRDERSAVERIIGRMSPPARKKTLPAFMHKIKAGLNDSVNKMKQSGGGGAKTRALREEFSDSGLRRSLALSSSRSSLPPSSGSGLVSKVSGRWKLKAMGLITMPDGSVLPQHLARSIMGDGKRYPELGDFGLGASRRASDVGPRPATMDGTFTPSSTRRTSHRPHASVTSFGGDLTNKRKRVPDDVETEEDGEDAQDSKRILLDTEKTIREMRRLREEMEEGTGWFREQNVRLQTGLSSRTGTPMEGV
ncbi:related to leucine permease transcriptional regulator SAC3 [Cephalotrichum gorgonifer]|uniref:Related to leucine permease transcriptional regulator SAC3 n=1 Tax=Cephalotrichum gorgonifer TaxID=2041049 RepID=A0AAE8MSJ9_9PEZI|nr:related to leucine permease transcriptional regulator SAC3 [Cephalotrichum gorgonifer]